MKTPTAILSGAVLGMLALAACGGGNSNSNPSVTVIPCVLPTGTQVALAYPISGATGVPDAPGQVVIAASPALPTNWQAVFERSERPAPLSDVDHGPAQQRVVIV